MSRDLTSTLRAQAAALRAQADTLDAIAAAAEQTTSTTDHLLDLAAIAERYGMARDGIVAAIRRGELSAVTGTRRRILIREGELERWLASRPYRPGPRRAESQPSDLEQWEIEAERALGGGE